MRADQDVKPEVGTSRRTFLQRAAVVGSLGAGALGGRSTIGTRSVSGSNLIEGDHRIVDDREEGKGATKIS